MTPSVGLIGTGIMGAHLARRLVQAGLAVRVWNRTAAKAAPLGAEMAGSPSEALDGADVGIVMLSTGPVTEDVLCGPDATGRTPIEALRPGATLVVMASVPVDLCKALAARAASRGVAFVDAPVSGGEAGARDGTLAILAGGDEAVIAALAPVFAPLGRATRLGPVGTGQLAKLANQIIVGGTLLAVAEAMHFARAGGADLGRLRQALLGGFGESRILALHGDRMARGDFVPGSPAVQQLKDMRTAQALAAENGLRLAQLEGAIDIFAAMADRGEGGIDVSGVILEVARRSAVSV